MRNLLIAGNWKMNQNNAETKAYFEGLSEIISEAPAGVELLLCPVYTSLAVAVETASSITGMHIGAQNLHFEDKGAYTGEITASMLSEIGVSHVLIGHSERRQYFNETDGTVNLKTKKALDANLVPVVCVGELLDERKSDTHFSVVKKQVTEGLKDVSLSNASKVVIAYEPVWAIGTGETASPDQAQEMHKFIRTELSKLYNEETADKIRILYGGSMNTGNAAELLSCSDVDGGLIGGASLKPESYAEIIDAAAKQANS
ncbi:MAG: triose-phosphate isomerase [Balneolales bacterium]|nr:triose-phosphate isomerase [Balneolales bacterium]